MPTISAPPSVVRQRQQRERRPVPDATHTLYSGETEPGTPERRRLWRITAISGVALALLWAAIGIGWGSTQDKANPRMTEVVVPAGEQPAQNQLDGSANGLRGDDPGVFDEPSK